MDWKSPSAGTKDVLSLGHTIRDEYGLEAQFPEQGSGASFVTASKFLDAVALLPGNCGEQSDAPSAYYLSWARRDRPPPAGAGGGAGADGVGDGARADGAGGAAADDDARAPWRDLDVRYFWFNGSAPAGTAANPFLGDLRNLLQDAADADGDAADGDAAAGDARDARDARARARPPRSEMMGRDEKHGKP